MTSSPAAIAETFHIARRAPNNGSNALTDSRQKVANCQVVTVERKAGNVVTLGGRRFY